MAHIFSTACSFLTIPRVTSVKSAVLSASVELAVVAHAHSRSCMHAHGHSGWLFPIQSEVHNNATLMLTPPVSHSNDLMLMVLFLCMTTWPHVMAHTQCDA